MSATRNPVHDERSSGQSEASRRGAHRARAKPLSAGLPILAGVLVIALVVGVAYLVLGRSGDDTSAGAGLEAAAAPDSTATITAGTQPKASTSASTAPGASKAGGTTTKKTTAAGGTVNRNVQLVVLNSTGVQGLAKKVAAKIEPAGWKVSRTDNSLQSGLSTTKIYYGQSGGKNTAQALANDLGYGTISQNATVAKTGLVVVLGRDAQ